MARADRQRRNGASTENRKPADAWNVIEIVIELNYLLVDNNTDTDCYHKTRTICYVK